MLYFGMEQMQVFFSEPTGTFFELVQCDWAIRELVVEAQSFGSEILYRTCSMIFWIRNVVAYL